MIEIELGDMTPIQSVLFVMACLQKDNLTKENAEFLRELVLSLGE